MSALTVGHGIERRQLRHAAMQFPDFAPMFQVRNVAPRRLGGDMEPFCDLFKRNIMAVFNPLQQCLLPDFLLLATGTGKFAHGSRYVLMRLITLIHLSFPG